MEFLQHTGRFRRSLGELWKREDEEERAEVEEGEREEDRR
jgi:hypothetical protein